MCVLGTEVRSLREFLEHDVKNIQISSEDPMKTFARILGFLFLVWVYGCLPKSNLPTGNIIDLTHPFDDQTIFWPTEKGFVFEKGTEGFTEKGYFYSANRFYTAEHGGTHIDAPIHFYEGRNTVDVIPLAQLIGDAIVVDVSDSCQADRDYQVQVGDFVEWEDKDGRMADHVIVMLRTGFGGYWPDRERYMGTSERGAEAVAKLHFPGLHPEAARWLVRERSIKAIRIDTQSIDFGQSTHFETHVALFEANIPAFENVANLHQLPEKGFTIIALPMKIKGGSGGPLRIVAMVE